jgi:hypothetical protein
MRLCTVAAHPAGETPGARGTTAWHAALGDTAWACHCPAPAVTSSVQARGLAPL